MIRKIIPAFFCLLASFALAAQQPPDSTIQVGKKMIVLSEVVVNNKLNVPAFINRVKEDTTFYKAFRNLRVLGFTAINDIRMTKKDGSIKASLHSTTRQTREHGCRKMQVLSEEVTGDIYDDDRNFNYYTGQMYASLFFTKDSVCGEDNIVAGHEFSTEGKSGIDKHKEQLKKLFFNPGKKISGIPFISNKTAIFDDDMADKYDMSIDIEDHNQVQCYIFKLKVKPGMENDVVIDEMTTWFDDKTNEVVARNYSLSYDAGVYDLKVNMEVELTHVGTYIVPSVIRYNGNWKVMFKDRERGVFTATLSDFTPEK